MKNALKQRLSTGACAYGTFVWTASTFVVECLGYSGLDYVIIDAEHSPVDTEGAVNMVRTAEVHGLTPLVRTMDSSRPAILKMLDLGAAGVIIPNLSTVEEVKKTVAFAKYHPIGQRGFAQCRRAGYGFEKYASDMETYLLVSNSETLLLPMCETASLLEQIEEVAAISGVDGIFVGPYDLSLDMGIPGQFERPEFREALQRIADACRRAGKYAMIFAGSPEAAVGFVRMGYQAVALGLDTANIIRTYRDMIAKTKEELAV